MKKLITALLMTLFFGCLCANNVRNDTNDIKIYQGNRLVKQLTLKEFYTLVEKARIYEAMVLSEESGRVVIELGSPGSNEFKIIWYNDNKEVVKEVTFQLVGEEV